MNQFSFQKVWRIASSTIQVLLCAAAGTMLYQLWDLQMLPARYFLVLAAVVLVLVLLICLLMHRPREGKWQKKQQHWLRQAIGLILAALMIAGSAAGIYAMSTLKGTLSSITDTDETVHVLLEVYVRADDPAQYVQDTANYLFAIADSTDEEDNMAAVADLEALLGSPITAVRYTSAFEMIDALYAGEVNAIILDSSYLSILDSQDGYADFDSRVRLLHEYVITKDPEQSDNGQAKPDNEYTQALDDPSKTPFLFYISGNDARRELLADGGSDVNILVVVNPVDHQILMVNTPRDYYVVNPASPEGSRDKLSHCGLKGINNCIQAITGLYGIPINYYARINFTGFRTLIDAIGGVTVYSPIGFSAGGYYFREGENHLNGDQALKFARERKNLAGGDNDRGKNQMRLIEGMINKLASGTLLTNYGQIMESLEGMFTTSMSAADIAKLVQLQLLQMPDWEIYTFAVTGDGGSDFCWAAGGNGYVMYPHENVVEHAVWLMKTVLSGKKITAEDVTVK